MTDERPTWGIPKVDNIPAEEFFKDFDEKLLETTKACKLFLQTYEMTGQEKFLDLAELHVEKSNTLRRLREENMNLYWIVTKGYGLN